MSKGRGRRRTAHNNINAELAELEVRVRGAVWAALDARAPRDVFMQLHRAWGDVVYAANVAPHERGLLVVKLAEHALAKWDEWKKEQGETDGGESNAE